MKLNRGIGRLKKPKLILPVLIVLLLVITFIMVVHNLNAPAVGDIDQTASAPPEKKDPYAQPGTYRGKYINFTYPAHFKKTPARLSGSALEIINLHTTDLSGKQIAIEVRAGSTETNGDVQFRRLNKALYKETDSQKWIEFTKTDGTEDTFFLEHNGLVASVSATSPGGGLSGESSFVASGLKWR